MWRGTRGSWLRYTLYQDVVFTSVTPPWHRVTSWKLRYIACPQCPLTCCPPRSHMMLVAITSFCHSMVDAKIIHLLQEQRKEAFTYVIIEDFTYAINWAYNFTVYHGNGLQLRQDPRLSTHLQLSPQVQPSTLEQIIVHQDPPVKTAAGQRTLGTEICILDHRTRGVAWRRLWHGQVHEGGPVQQLVGRSNVSLLLFSI